jgi:hypothetical protein
VWCGVGGCSQRSRGSAVEVVLLAVGAGAVMGLTVGFVPWTTLRGLRAAVGVGVGLAVTACVAGFVLTR